jgi:hypothetical protein
MKRKKKKTAGSGKKASSATVKLRVAEILRIRLAGAAWPDIVRFASETPDPDDGTGRPWNVGERQLQNYLEKADQLLEQRLEKRHDRLFNMHIARREALYAQTLQTADHRTALAVLKDAAELQGLYPPKKVEQTATAQLHIVEEIVDAGSHHENGQAAPDPGGLPPE